ncbi:MAG: hypothetical protein HOV97_09525, partial [Nonomuraea sp.]|nr:hypothetical protein [Nonomuraea sp.]
MTLSTPLLAAAPLIAGLMGPAILGAVPGQQQADRPAAAALPAAGRTHTPAIPEAGRAPRAGQVVEHVAARDDAEQRRVLDYW